MSEAPPTYTSLADIYTSPDPARYAQIRAAFVAKFSSEPDFFCRAPGRVNLIGEHVDYCGFPVLPMAIEQDIVIAVRVIKGDKELVISNTDAAFPDHIRRSTDLAISEVKWWSYVMAGYRGVSERVNSIMPGVKLLVDGAVPKAAGLSSSSALVCCSALATATLLDLTLSKSELAELCARSERHVLTQGGGMDQAISFLGTRGRAQLINFNPLKCDPVTLPQGVAFVIANTMVNKWKADNSDYNNRVADCRLAAKLIALKAGKDWRSVKTLHNVMTILGLNPTQLKALVNTHIDITPYTKEQLLSVFEIDEEEFKEIIVGADSVEFLLYNRAAHVCSEAERVDRFYELCTSTQDVAELGALMNGSHYSLRDLFDVSIDELEELTTLCREQGALGSRLTGAGFGGCTVSMVECGKVEGFMKGVYEGYFAKRGVKEVDVGQYLFSSLPGQGACVFRE